MCRNKKTKAVFNEFYKLAKEECIDITAMRGIKLVYLAHGYCLGLLGKPLIDDNVEAWSFGAVIRSLYDEVKIFGVDPVTVPILLNRTNQQDVEIIENGYANYVEGEVVKAFLNDNERAVINKIWDLFGEIDDDTLAHKTTAEGTPWEQVWSENSSGYAIISEDKLKEYYSAMFIKAKSNFVRRAKSNNGMASAHS